MDLLSRSPTNPGPEPAWDPVEAHRQAWRRGLPDLDGLLAQLAGRPVSERVALLCEDQEQHWRRGRRLPAEVYFSRYPELRSDAEYAVDLVFHEYLLRERLLEDPTLAEFQGRFPEYAEALSLQLDVHRAVDEQTEILADWPRLPGYEIEAELGSGGMGVVYRARQLSLQRQVAVKLLREGLLVEDALVRFRIEANILARFQHPNIVQIIEVGECPRADGGSVPFLVLELVSGGSLADQLRAGPVSAMQAAQWVEQLARAMAVAHEAGVIHRDLKPANVLLNPGLSSGVAPFSSGVPGGDPAPLSSGDPVPRITDFGLACRIHDPSLDRLTITGAILGTPAYMAPEQARGRPEQITPAVDIYALGAILHECLTGRPPFSGATALETLTQVLNDEPLSVRRLRPEIPRDLETITRKCLEKDPARRYPSALALAEDLRRFQEGRPVTARPLSTWQKVGRWAWRRPAVAGLLVALVLALSLGVAGIAWQWLRAEREAEQARRARDRSEANFRQLLEMNADVVALAERLKPIAGTRSELIEEILRQTEARYDRFLAEVGPLPQVRAGKARMLTTFADIHHELRSVQRARTSADEAVNIYGDLLARNQADNAEEETIWRIGLASALLQRGIARTTAGATREAALDFTESREVRRQLAEGMPASSERWVDLAESIAWQGALELERGKFLLAETHVQESLTLSKQVVEAGNRSPRALARLAACHETLGEIRWVWLNYQDAGEEYRRALALYHEAARTDPTSAEFIRHMNRLRISCCSAHFNLEEKEVAVAELNQVQAAIRNQVALNPGNARLQDQLLRVEMLREEAREKGWVPRDDAFALEVLERYRDLIRENLKKDPEDNYTRQYLGTSLMMLARFHLNLAANRMNPEANRALARQELAEAAGLIAEALRRSPDNARNKRLLEIVRSLQTENP